MPLVALDADGMRIDSTACPDEFWRLVHKATPRAHLVCPGCDRPVHAKVSSSGLRFFSHDRHSPGCPSVGETPEHRWLKAILAEAIRSAGCDAAIEAPPTDDDLGGWRADVLAVAPEGRRVAFEAQLAAMTLDEGVERTDRYQRDQIAAVWVTTKNAPWLLRLPSAKIGSTDGSLVMEHGPADLVVQRGCAQLEGSSSEYWTSRQDVPLQRLVEGILLGRTRSISIRSLSEAIPFGFSERHYFHSVPVVLAPVSHIEVWEEHRKRAERQEARNRADREAHLANLRALAERQTAVLRCELERLAAQQADRRERVWLGVPSTKWSGDTGCDPRIAGGNESTAMGLVIWEGESKDALHLAAVVCPVASRITASLAESWARRNVRVLAETPGEARRLATALGWSNSRVEVVPAGESTNRQMAREDRQSQRH